LLRTGPSTSIGTMSSAHLLDTSSSAVREGHVALNTLPDARPGFLIEAIGTSGCVLVVG